MTTEKLPKIIAVLGCEDHGPCDGGATAVCPHCGADGRFIYRFICDDGSERGAMAGCIKLFPKSPLAFECEKALDAMRHLKKGGYVSRANRQMLDGIDQLRAGKITVQDLERIANDVKAQKIAWMRSKGYRR